MFLCASFYAPEPPCTQGVVSANFLKGNRGNLPKPYDSGERRCCVYLISISRLPQCKRFRAIRFNRRGYHEGASCTQWQHWSGRGLESQMGHVVTHVSKVLAGIIRADLASSSGKLPSCTLKHQHNLKSQRHGVHTLHAPFSALTLLFPALVLCGCLVSFPTSSPPSFPTFFLPLPIPRHFPTLSSAARIPLQGRNAVN